MGSARLGQHFLINQNIAEKMVKTLLPVEGPILEIGPGMGILTDLLVKHCKENKIFTVELDRELYYKIKIKYGEDVEVINRSILEINLEDLCSHQDINLIGNVPYYISREIIDWIIFQNERIPKGMLMMQKEFVDKLIPKETPGNSNPQSLMLNHLFNLKKLFDVNPGSFFPPPKVRSRVFLFARRGAENQEEIDIKNFYSFLKHCFKNRRKTLINNLSSKYPDEKLWEIFETLDIDPRVRAEQLTLKYFLEISTHLSTRL